MEPLTGDDPAQLGGYQLRARLGVGGMGRVYLAFTAGGRPVALKVIRPELSGDPGFRSRFRQEVEAARRVHGLFTAQVLDADVEATPPWLVTAYVPGPSLQEAVSEHGPLPPGTALLLAAGVAEALQAIHAAGLVHRDLKPSNVLLAPDGPRVIDFGIARTIESTAVTRTGLQVGSPPYMAPEQARGLPVTPATDVFALGSVVAFTVTGEPPFGDGNQQAILYRVVYEDPDLAGCPAPLRALVARCLAKAPAERPAPAQVIAECRAHADDPGAPGQPLVADQAWLPRAVSAGLARHAPPSFPDATPPHTTTAPGTQPSAAIPASSRPGRLSRRALLALLAAVVVLAGAGTALGVTLGSRDGASPGGPAASTSAPPTTASTSATAATASAPAGQATGAACVAGSWQTVSQRSTFHIGSTPVTFAGAGAKEVYRADGTLTDSYDNLPYNSTDLTYKVIISGTVTGHWSVSGGQFFYTDMVSSATQLIFVDGVQISDGPFMVTASTGPFRCTGNTFQVTYSNGGGTETDKLVRVAASR